MRLPRIARACAWCFHDSSSFCWSNTIGAVIEGRTLFIVFLVSVVGALASSWKNVSSVAGGAWPLRNAAETELAVLDDVNEGIETELPIDDPEREVATDTLLFKFCGVTWSIGKVPSIAVWGWEIEPLASFLTFAVAADIRTINSLDFFFIMINFISLGLDRQYSPCISKSARCWSASSLNRTNPYPLDIPVTGSNMIFALLQLLNGWMYLGTLSFLSPRMGFRKTATRSELEVSGAKSPTKMLYSFSFWALFVPFGI